LIYESKEWSKGAQNRKQGKMGGGRLNGGGRKSMIDALTPNSRSFDQKDLSIERSGTASVATTSPHAEFPDRRSGRLKER
jgi:hypothetical protein